MSPKFYVSERVDWIDPNDKLTPDQWLTIHLVFLNTLEINISFPGPIMKREDIVSYIDKAKVLFKSTINKTPEKELSGNLELANQSLKQLYENVYNCDSLSAIVIKSFFFKMLGMVAENAQNIFLKDKTYSEYFTDIYVDKYDNVISNKALEILHYFGPRVEDVKGVEFAEVAEKESLSSSLVPASNDLFELDEKLNKGNYGFDEGDPDYAYLDSSEILLKYYTKKCQSEKEILVGMSLEALLAFHTIVLCLCQKCLEPKRYSKYYKAAIKAISSYKNGQNIKQQEFYLASVTAAYEKLKESLIKWIEQEFDDDSDESLRQDYFILGTNNGLLDLRNQIQERAVIMLDSVSLDGDNISFSPLVDYFANEFYQVGEENYDYIVDLLDDYDWDEDDDNDDDWDDDDWDDDEDDWDDDEDDWDDDDEFWDDDEDDWDDDDDDDDEFWDDDDDDDDDDEDEDDDDWDDDDWDDDDDDDDDEDDDEDDDDDEFWDEDDDEDEDDDWNDDEDDEDYDWDDDDEDSDDDETTKLEDQLKYEKYKKNIRLVVNELDLNKSVVAHVIIPNILVKKLPKRFSTKYRKAARELVDLYCAGDKNQIIESARIKADEAFLELHDSICKITNDMLSEDAPENIYDYVLSSLAIDYALLMLYNDSQKNVKKCLKDLVFTEKAKEYHNVEIDALTFASLNYATYMLQSD